MSKYLIFQDGGKSESGLTLIVDVISKKHGYPLGQIKWHGPWRDYVFHPDKATLFNRACMKCIADKLAKMFMDHHAKCEEKRMGLT